VVVGSAVLVALFGLAALAVLAILEVLVVAAVVTLGPAPPAFLESEPEPQPAMVSELIAATAASAPADRENRCMSSSWKKSPFAS
jgi:hypothetical protein